MPVSTLSARVRSSTLQMYLRRETRAKNLSNSLLVSNLLPLHIQTLKTNDDTQCNEYYSKCDGGGYFEDPNKAMFILQYDS